MANNKAKNTSKKSGSKKAWKKWPTFGFLLASLHTGASQALWTSLIDSAERYDVNLICFPGGRLRAQVALESQRNVIYDLAGKFDTLHFFSRVFHKLAGRAP